MKPDWSWKPDPTEVRRFKKKKKISKRVLKKLRKAEGKSLRSKCKMGIYIPPDDFFGSYAWRCLRQDVFRAQGRRCLKCGSRREPLHIDHVKSRWRHPELQLDYHNLQVLCEPCNMEKGIRSTPEDDHRIRWDEVDLLINANTRI